MRKFYLLTSLILLLFGKAKGQDTANFSFTIGLNNQVFFTNTSHLHGDAPRKAFWYFGDGASQVTAALANTFYQYKNAGTYTVCLKIYKYSTTSHDSAVTADICKKITLTTTSPDGCKAEFSNAGTNASPLAQVFTAKTWHSTNKKPEEICWNFGDNRDTCIKYDPALSSDYAVRHLYARPGTYKVCLRVRFQGGCVAEYCRAITIAGDECKVDYTVERVNLSPLSRRFVAHPGHSSQKRPVRICWNFGDGTTECKQYTSSTSDPYAINHTYAKAGQYNVCVSVLFDGGCETKMCRTVTVENPPPPADKCYVNVFEVPTQSFNLERHFYAGIMPDRRPERICWSFGDGLDSCVTIPNPVAPQSLVMTHRYPAPGVYRLCVKIKYADGCEAHKCREVVIRPATSVCGGYIADSMVNARTFAFRGFSIHNANEQVVAWRWSFGDGSSSNDRAVTHTYAAAGKYEVCLYIKTDRGCETKICKTIVVQGENQPILQLAPNPVTTTLYATFLSSLQEQVTINIYNANGILIKTYTRMAVKGRNTWEFNVSALPAGIYSVVVTSPHQLANAIFFKR